MKTLPSYIGPAAFGIKMGVFLPGSDLVGEIVKRARDCAQDGLLADGDVLCITESVVARVQGNIVSVEYVAQEIREKLGLSVESTVGVLFPITSRNRFALILESIALAVPEGKVIVQLNYPADEVGNQTIGLDFLASLDLKEDYIPQEMLNGYTFVHPITKVDYVQYYKEVIAKTGATPEIIFSNNPQHIARYSVDGVIVADIHRRHRTLGALKEVFSNCITLQDICNSGLMRSDWGLLGSNMSSDGMLKLAPRDGQQVVDEIQRAVYEETGKRVEIIIYGDGAYKDPSTGIYELADPETVVAATQGLADRMRCGVKYKYIADLLYAQGKDAQEIERYITSNKEAIEEMEMASEGTTPRQLKDILASLADLISGSSDAGTPLVLIKGINGK